MTRFIRALGALLVPLLLGCDGRPTGECDDIDPSPPIVPLASGNAWAYVDSVYYGPDSTGVDSTWIDILGERVLTVDGVARTAYLWNVRDRGTGLPGALTLFVANRSDGNYTLGAARDTAEFLFETLHVKHPGTRGERYTTYFLDLRPDLDNPGAYTPVIDTIEVEVAVPDTVITTPAGAFACTEYHGMRAGVLFARTWYAPGVGYLGSESVRPVEVNGETRQVVFRKRLVRYDLK